jgi:hypothetical protein
MNNNEWTWAKLIAIVIIALLIGWAVTGCSLYQKDKEFESSCKAACQDCQGLVLSCDHIQVNEDTVTQNHPHDPDKKDYAAPSEDAD